MAKTARPAKAKIVFYPIGSPEGVAEAERRIATAAREGATELDLGGLGLEEIPYSLLELKQLDTLYLGLPKDASEKPYPEGTKKDKKSRNAMSALPPAFFKSLLRLTKLHLEHNHLATLPDTIGHLQRLQELHLGHNQLATVPETIGRLQNLKWLYLNNNRLSALPDAIGQLRNLRMLFLDSNRLADLPDTFGQLQSLRMVFFQNNADLPPQYAKAWKEGGIAALAEAIRRPREEDGETALAACRA
jgi:Leucine-rich repeat (LRR) protein